MACDIRAYVKEAKRRLEDVEDSEEVERRHEELAWALDRAERIDSLRRRLKERTGFYQATCGVRRGRPCDGGRHILREGNATACH